MDCTVHASSEWSTSIAYSTCGLHSSCIERVVQVLDVLEVDYATVCSDTSFLSCMVGVQRNAAKENGVQSARATRAKGKASQTTVKPAASQPSATVAPTSKFEMYSLVPVQYCLSPPPLPPLSLSPHSMILVATECDDTGSLG